MYTQRVIDLYLMSQVVHSQDRASLLVDTMRSVFGSQKHRHQGAMPVIGNEDAVISKQALIQLQDERSLQRCHIQQSKPELQSTCIKDAVVTADRKGWL